jgi:hypothetical protein
MRLREGDVRTLHRFQLGAQQLLLGGGPVWPPLDPEFSFREASAALRASPSRS